MNSIDIYDSLVILSLCINKIFTLLFREGLFTGENMRKLLTLFVFAVVFAGLFLTACDDDKNDGNDFDYGCVDYDGIEYDTLRLGNQLWMAENLRSTHFRDGTPISLVSDSIQWPLLDTRAYCYYDNDSSRIEGNGMLYNGYAVMDLHNLAPDGWHIPTDEEWKELELYLGMNENALDSIWSRGSDEGSNLAGELALWWSGLLTDSPNLGSSGFNALPSGYRHSNGRYFFIGQNAYFWTSTMYSDSEFWVRYLTKDDSGIGRHHQPIRNGFSVRCIRDTEQ